METLLEIVFSIAFGILMGFSMLWFANLQLQRFVKGFVETIETQRIEMRGNMCHGCEYKPKGKEDTP